MKDVRQGDTKMAAKWRGRRQDSLGAQENRDDPDQHLTLPTVEERAAALQLHYEGALDALENEDPVAVVMATEYIVEYAKKAGELLKEGKDYLALLAPDASTPAIKRIAMEMVLETLEEELNNER